MRNTWRLTSLLVTQDKCLYALTVEQCMLCNLTLHTWLREEFRGRKVLQQRLGLVEVAEQWDQQSSAIRCSCTEIACDPCDWPVTQTPTTFLTEGQAPHLVQCIARSIFLWWQCNSLVMTFSWSALINRYHWLFYRNTCSFPPCLPLSFP